MNLRAHDQFHEIHSAYGKYSSATAAVETASEFVNLYWPHARTSAFAGKSRTGRSTSARRLGKPVITRKNISEVALQPLHDLLQPSQSDALIAPFQSIQSRWRQTHFSREFGEGFISTSSAQEFGKLFVERTRHPIVLPHLTFRMRNNFRFWNGICILSRIIVIMNPSPKLHILIVDDEAAVTFSIRFALKDSGYWVEAVADGEEALAKIAASTQLFDLVITDNNMPRVPGIELVARLRSNEFQGKIIVLSAHLSPEIREAYGAMAVDLMMPKPFDVFELRRAIDSMTSATPIEMITIRPIS